MPGNSICKDMCHWSSCIFQIFCKKNSIVTKLFWKLSSIQMTLFNVNSLHEWVKFPMFMQWQSPACTATESAYLQSVRTSITRQALHSFSTLPRCRVNASLVLGLQIYFTSFITYIMFICHSRMSILVHQAASMGFLWICMILTDQGDHHWHNLSTAAKTNT